MSRETVLPPAHPTRSYKERTGCGNLFITIVRDQTTNQITDIFANLGKSGTCPRCFNEALARTVSLAIQAGVEPVKIISTLKGLECGNQGYNEAEVNLSCADCLAKALEKDEGLNVE